MEIQLKVPLVEKYYSALAVTLIIIRFPLFLAFGFFRVVDNKPLSIFLFIAFMAATIANTYIKKYKKIGEIILGYHSVTVNGQTFLIRDMQKLYIRIETGERSVRTLLPTFLTGANNFVFFYINEVKQTYRLLIIEQDVKAVVFLSKQWKELHGEKFEMILF
ncbi:hypothetical protein [Chitinophaga sancti]|uniref:Uncharacterized protein n=1 Tax=Chitinophaga sancti TaxID=1004 RepID=A0A1K1MKL6_9BACT|nr:hypothetical protein [Chitinophaga sancti]WQD62770.1 hypothetical protein U0033_00080 [Chitinophaga sancti]WQG91606.1 hypothetical protein SR876_08835 [Chitinophaga sancti]SFW23696.1 hypothetical protein SAMN05661012_00661 [Chitinophaga sancti]